MPCVTIKCIIIIIMLSVIKLNVVMVNCVAPQTHLFCLLDDDSLALLFMFVGVKTFVMKIASDASSTYLGSLGTVMTRPVQYMCYDDKISSGQSYRTFYDRKL
jgi:hypothetical protein